MTAATHFTVAPAEPGTATPACQVASAALALLLAQPQQAAEMGLQAVDLAQESRDAAGECFGWLVAACSGLRADHSEEAAGQLQHAQALLPRHSDARVHALAEHVKAVYLRRQGQPEHAMALLESLHARAAQRPPLDAYLSAAALGTCRSVAGDVLASLADYYDALHLATRSGVLSAEVNALNNLGSVQLDLYNLEDARPLLERCLAGAQQLGSRRQIIFAAGNLVTCLCSMGLPAQALAVARSELIARIEADDGPSLQRDEEIAHALLDSGLADEAAAYLAREPQYDPLTNETTAYRSWLEVRLLMARNDPRAALARCLRHAPHHDQDNNVPLDRLHLAEAAAAAAAACSEWRVAYEQMQAARFILDQLLGRAANARSASLKIQYELERTLAERDSARDLATRLKSANVALECQVKANAELQQQLRAQALEDPLTGLYNRRYLFQAGPALLDQARRQQQPLAAVMVDLDHFKRINDEHGHDVGDRVLQGFADLAKSAVRASDLCCRYGGEEFAVLLSAADADVAQRRMNQLLQSFAAMPFDTPAGKTFTASFSAGLALADGSCATLDDLLRRADEALYTAKRAGRQRVEVFSA